MPDTIPSGERAALEELLAEIGRRQRHIAMTGTATGLPPLTLPPRADSVAPPSEAFAAAMAEIVHAIVVASAVPVEPGQQAWIHALDDGECEVVLYDLPSRRAIATLGRFRLSTVDERAAAIAAEGGVTE